MLSSYIVAMALVSLSTSVYSAPGHRANVSDFMCDILIGILHPLMHILYFRHMAYIWHLQSIFVAGTYFAVVC